MPSDRAILPAALAAARKAGDIALRVFRGRVRVGYKSDSSPVTDADRAGEEAIRRLLTRAFPGDGFIGEEYGTSGGSAEAVWTIDPIDGTKNFIRGIPFWGCLIARIFRGRVTHGVMHLPALDETLWAVRGKGAFLNGRRLRVSRVRDLRRSYVLYGGLSYFVRDKALKNLAKIASKCHSTRCFGDCWSYAFVARGQAEAMFEADLKPWDNAPTGLIVSEAGGRATDWKGHEDWRSPSLLATNGLIHSRLLKLLRR